MLLEAEINISKNLLPLDGTVNYYGKIISTTHSNYYFEKLLNTIIWENDKVIIFGKTIITKRKVAWYADTDFEYRYSNCIKKAFVWTKELADLKAIVEKISGESYNSCLLNLYHTGEEGMSWHSDNEKELKKNGAIASLSFGVARKFLFKHKQTKQIVHTFLEHGSLLIMKETTQTHWQHKLPTSTKVKTPRINLTFRTIG